MTTLHSVSVFCFGRSTAVLNHEVLNDEQLQHIRDTLPDPNGVIEIDRGADGTVVIPARAVAAVYIFD